MTVMPEHSAPVPSPYDVRASLGGLLGRAVTVRLTDPYAPEPGETTTYAVYVDERLRTRAVAVADLRFSAYAGAAAALFPPGVAEESLAQGVLGERLGRHLHEVLDGFASVFTDTGTPETRLHAVYAAGSAPPSDVVSFASTPGRRLDLLVDVAQHGTGCLSVVCVP